MKSIIVEHKAGQRVIRFSNLKAQGLPVDELEVFVSYQGHSNCEKGVTVDMLIPWIVRVLNDTGFMQPICAQDNSGK